MKKTLLLMALFSSVLLAEIGKLYVEVGGSLFTHEKKENGLKNDLDSTAFRFTLGSMLIEEEKYLLSLEGSFMLGLDGDVNANVEQNNGNSLTNAKLYVDKLYGMNLKVTVPLTTQLKFNGYLGASHAKTIAKADNYSQSNGFDTSLTYGGGIDYAFDSNVYLFTNYMQYFKNLNAVELGLGFRF